MKNIKIKKGFTLIELLLVVGLISVISIGIYVVLKKVQENQKVQETTQFVKLILDRISDAAAAADNYENFANDLSGSNLSTVSQLQPPENVIRSRVVPDKYINGNFVVDPFGRAYVGFNNQQTQSLTSMSAGRNLIVTVFVENPGQCIKTATALATTYDALAITTVGAGEQFYSDLLVKPMNENFDRENVNDYCMLGTNGSYMHFGISKPIINP